MALSATIQYYEFTPNTIFRHPFDKKNPRYFTNAMVRPTFPMLTSILAEVEASRRRGMVVSIGDQSKVCLRERKKESTRAKLLEAALNLINRHGYDATSIDDIVKVAGVSKRTFFRYFGSKDDVLVAWVGQFGEHACKLLVSRPKDEIPMVALQNALIRSVRLYELQYFLSIPLERATNNNPAILARKLLKLKLCAEAMSDALARRMNSSINKDFSPSVLAHCAMAVLLVASDAFRAQGSKGKLSTVLTRAFSLMKIDIRSA